jgi:hypothetical protein
MPETNNINNILQISPISPDLHPLCPRGDEHCAISSSLPVQFTSVSTGVRYAGGKHELPVLQISGNLKISKYNRTYTLSTFEF